MSSFVYQHHPNGTTYIYKNESYWDKETKTTKHIRTYIGRQHAGSDEIIPPNKEGGESNPRHTEPKDGYCTSLVVGPTLLLDKAASETRLKQVLGDVFPDDSMKILTCAYYLACEGKALSHVEQWSERSVHPLANKLDSQRVSELLTRITPSKQQEFFQKWIGINSKTGYFAMDITSVSSYSDCIDYVNYGYNRDGEDLEQINLLMLTCDDTRVPVYFRILDGAVKDVSTVQESLENLSFLNCKNLRLVMDKGFYSAPNVNALYDHHFKFSVGVPFVGSLARDAVERNRDGIKSFHNYISIGQEDAFAVTENIPWGGHRCYMHTFFDEDKAVQEDKKFLRRIHDCYEELTSHNEKQSNQSYYKKYFTVKDMPKRGRKVTPDDEAIEEHRKNTCGWFVMISNDEKNAEKALRTYRQKDAIEKEFDDLKNKLDMNRLRMHNDQTMEGRIFVQFVSLILVTYLRCIMDDTGLNKKYNLQDVFEEMKSIQRISLEGRKKQYHTVPSKKQREIADAFEIKI